ncbi:MAG: sensor histidine kinase [Lachnospiraceae bacterium]|nr:sensor histidine kinase [Lachnospiraceae bacterium]
MIWLKWLKRNGRNYAVGLLLMISFNLYFIFLMRTTQIKYLLYLDLLLLVLLAVIEGTAFFDYCKKECRKKVLLQEDDFIYETLGRLEDSAVFEHDMLIMEKQLQEKYEENCGLQDYVAKWCHEFKIPLSAALLISAKIKDTDIRTDMKEQLERMNWQMSMMMQGCRLQSPMFDLQMRQVPLQKCVRASIKNNQFFLIQKRFQMDMEIEDVTVYTDEVWLTYILDQILNNAVKYARPEIESHIRFWTDKSPELLQIKLFIEDNGEGIQECDIRRIFEKGYTGSNYHNGKYKSTGMGLYMADKIAEKLEHTISVESRYGEYTRFCIVLCGR